MCGHCGVIRSDSFSAGDFDKFKALLYLSAYRGVDSTGVFAVSRKKFDWKDDEIENPWIKTTDPSFTFLDEQINIHERDRHWTFQDLFKKRVFAGHTRAATKGDIKVDNAHPFEFDKLIGSHNGTIHLKFKHTEEYETDSQALMRCINDYGIDEALNMVRSLTSAYALVYYDKEKQTMNFIRNAERPLYFTFFDDKKSMMWASEELFLEFTAKKFHLKISGWPKTADIFTLGVNKLLSIPVNHDKNMLERADLREVKIKEPILPAISNYKNRGKGYSVIEYEDGGKKKTHRFFDNRDRKWKEFDPDDYDLMGFSDLDDRDFDNGRMFKGYNNVYITASIFRKKLERGCCICGDPISHLEKDIDNKIGWYNAEDVICELCVKKDWVSWSLNGAPLLN